MVAADPSPYSGVKPGESIFRAPHRLRCASCVKVSPLFDPQKDGYDGALCHGSSYPLGGETDEEAAFIGGAYEITIGFTYNIELE